jgi:hormone-sensitive lipase
VTASSLFTGGRFAIDPELRGAEFERIIQNLDVHFWKAFWNITEIEVLSVSSEPGESPGMLTDRH